MLREKVASESDRRVFHRQPCLLPADIDDYDNAYSGFVRNIGWGGAYVETLMPYATKIGQEVILTVPFENRADYLIIKAKVAWVQPHSVGVTFIKDHSIC